MNHYEQKQEARRERLEAKAERLNKEGTAKFNSGMERLRAIPFGQPILIGHHSEKRDRNYRRKAGAAVDKGIELHKAAQEAAARAASVGTGGISSDDPDAPDKLKEKLARMEADQERMKLANKMLRAGDDQGLRDIGFTDATIAALKVPQWGNGRGPTGFPPYALTNNGANIRRVKERIAHLERAATREHQEVAVGNTGIRIVQNVEANRLQIFYPGKPPAEVRAQLKGSGFRWAPSEGAWQRHLSNAAIYAAKEITKQKMEE